MLREAHTKLGASELEKRIAGNSPFDLKPLGDFQTGLGKPYQRGVLLTHGLTDSPYFMRYLAYFFQRNGFRVMAILLPGHGTQAGDLLTVRWQAWAQALAYGAEKLNCEVDKLYLAGYSTGGALSVYHSLKEARVRGLFLFSPAFKISPRAAYAHWHQLYSWLIPSKKWVSRYPDRDIYKYESMTKNAVSQTYALTRALAKKLQTQEITIPVFAAASLDDSTVDTQATLDFMRRVSESHLLLYRADTQTHGLADHKIEYINSVMPEHKILSYSHSSIIIPATDTHYGESGEYCNCLHYYPDDMEKYTACIEHPENANRGEITPKNLAIGLLRRLTYNPRFAQLETIMAQFINKLNRSTVD
ncbi:MAG: alpha/beta fold hydrolase [Gallionella sp.]